MPIYDASCHCAAVRFAFRSEPITSGRRCNCSMCVRKGVVMSAIYYAPDAIVKMEGTEALTRYQFGDLCVNHLFCKHCGVHPFHTVAFVPPGYTGTAKQGYYR